MFISIIIPTYNEALSIATLIHHIQHNSRRYNTEVIVSDGGSEDGTVALAKEAGALVLTSPEKGRAAQMNFGAAHAKGDVLYFVHADCLPPDSFVQDIQHAVSKGYTLGRYRTRFQSSSMILQLNAWFTRFDFFICMGGDQTLFITRQLFDSCGGFKNNMKIMEEYEFCERARKTGKYMIMKKSVLVSARKYETNSWLRVQLANAKVVRMYKAGAGQDAMTETYRQMLNYRKNAF